MNIQSFRNAEILTLLFLSAFSFQFSAFSQGSLTPPGAPAPTMKTLQQVEPRTPISSAPFTISTSGSYYLTTNISVSSGTAITITANNVTLDLNGFTISSTAAGGAGSGILLSGGRRNIAILNGQIAGDVSAANGFLHGIYWATTAPHNIRVTDLAVTGCGMNGISLGTDQSAVVERCTVSTVGAEGIRAGVVGDSTATECGATAILAYTASHCYGQSSASTGLFAITAANCVGVSASGIGLNAYSATDCYGASGSGTAGVVVDAASGCYGSSTSGDALRATSASNCYGSAAIGYGVYAITANNCYGTTASGTGVKADSANNCNGISGGSGTGLFAFTANNCSGVSGSGTGLSATTANNCRGDSSGTGYGLDASSSAVNCYGHSNGSIGLNASAIAIGCVGYTGVGGGAAGLNAYIANSCYGGGAPVTYTYHYNMPP